MGFFSKFKPVAAMIALQFGYAVMNILTKASLTGGMSPHVFIVYRQTVATLVISPVAYVLERKERPALRFRVFCQIFLISLIGIAVNQNIYFRGLDLASSTIAAAMTNSTPAVTFVIATVIGHVLPLATTPHFNRGWNRSVGTYPFSCFHVAWSARSGVMGPRGNKRKGLEKINIRGMRGQAKVLGAFVCVGGAMMIVFWKGPIVVKLWPPNFHMAGSHYLFTNNFVAEDWKIGCVYLFGSCLCWSTWMIMQSSAINKYPAQLSLTALMCFLGTLQSAIVTIIFLEADPKVWTLKWNFDLLCIVYSAIVGSVIALSVQTWCIYKRGPVFVAMFTPLGTVIVAIMASIILREKLHAGSVAGGILIVGGLYTVLWGKAKDIKLNAPQLPVMHPTESLPEPATNIDSADLSIDITEPLLPSKVSELSHNQNLELNIPNRL